MECSRMPGTASIFLFVCFVLITAQELYEDDVCKSVRGTQWTCKKIKECQKAIKLLQSGGTPQVCSFSGNEPVVCCEPDSGTKQPGPTTTRRPVMKKPTPTPTTTRRPVTTKPTTIRPLPTKLVQPGQKASQMCREYGELVYVTISNWDFSTDEDQKIDTCDRIEALITGGKDANPREFPHMAQIGYGQKLQNVRWKCGGSLISKNFVVSAAHCTDLYGVKAGWVRLGEYNVKLKTDEEMGLAMPAIHQIIERINHPNYKARNSENDITLYRLATDVEFNNYVRPICLQTEFNIPKSYAVACGWGDTSFGGPASDVLQKVNLTLTSAEACKGFYPANPQSLPNGIRTESMFCAGDDFSKMDTCQGDSGGPLQVAHSEVYCMYSLIGVTSFGQACAQQPGVYTRVSHYVPWIESIVWK